MKSYFLFIFIFWANLMFAQKQPTRAMKQAFDADNITMLLSELKFQDFSLNDCFEINGKNYSLLVIAIKMEKKEIIKALIKEKIELNKICADKSPLMYAAKYGQTETAKLLIEAGAQINLKNPEGLTALDYAIQSQQKEIEALLKSKK
ncbi:MAG: ankyrin repeat domain-containing protein [Raineya sp.]|nr:ankyrin repeat domain-containing protein [Raineya sp.]